VDALGLPIMASRSQPRPGSSNAVYPHSGTTFAGSSSSLVNTGIRGQSDTNLATFVVPSPGPGSGPVAASEAPHLSTTESFFGRMTLTAPDNMRRKKAEEREKKKQIRKRRAERGANAAANIANPPDVGPSHMLPPQNVLSNVISTGLTAAAEPASTARRRKRPTLPTSNSGSNLQTYTLEQSRSRSPTRPLRSQSGQNSQSNSRQASPERRQVRRRNRGGSDASAIESGILAAPTYQHASTSSRRPSAEQSQPTTQQLASLPTAAQQRRDIYADLDTLGLPGADESDLEDQPPPFPANATRPISPPRMPVDGEEWTEDMRRRQEEYEMNRPPDSPPPAFRSDDETGSRSRQMRQASEQLSSSDEESDAEEIARERREWEEDVAAGFSLEERIERDRLRREIREEFAAGVNAAVAPIDTQTVAMEQSSPEANDTAVEDVISSESPSQSILEEQAKVNEQHASEQVAEQPVNEQADVAKEVNTPIEPESPQSQLNLGKLVMEARARRASAARKRVEEMAIRSAQLQSLQKTEGSSVGTNVPAGRSLAAALHNDPSVPILGSSLPSHGVSSQILQSPTSQPLQKAVSQPSKTAAALPADEPEAKAVAEVPPSATPFPATNHQRVASDSNAEQSTSQSVAASAESSLPVLKVAKKAPQQETKPGQVKKVRSKPTGESHSRFRDGASAAANRRMALWGPAKSAPDHASLVDIRGHVQSNDAQAAGSHDKDSVSLDESVAPHPQLLRQASSSSKSFISSAHESDGEASSDSDGKWEKEEAAFKALQNRLAPPPVADIESSDEDDVANQDADQRPRWFRSNSIDLAKPGSSVPKAPPPLVLGRSRGGGAEYSSSSESSSDSGANRMDDSDDDSLSPEEIEDFSSQGRPSFDERPLDKGKQPLRPALVDADRTVSAPPSSLSAATTVRAGEFEEDSGSSHDFASDEGEQGHVESRPAEDLNRPQVGNRLKTLFSMPLGNSSQTSATGLPAATRTSIGNLFEKQIDTRTTSSARQPIRSNTEAEIISKQPSEKSLRAKEWADAYATLEARQQRDPISEQQARQEALEHIARLQVAGAGSNAPSGVNHDSLEALERLLSRRSYVPSVPSIGQAEDDRRSTLRRSGAINRSNVAAPFVNPRSSVAPRPLGRLPTITNATRHFPPSRQTTEEPSNVSSPSYSTASLTPRDGRSVISSSNWMNNNIPDSDRRGLPEPLEPVKKSRDMNPNGPPPPLPLRSSNNRVLAMVERFEGQLAEQTSPVTSPRSPSREQFSLVTSSSNDEVARANSLRRRPPPPPPSIAHHGTNRRPVSASVSSNPPSSAFLPSSSSLGEGLNSVPVKPFKPPFLQDHGRSEAAEASTSQAPVLSHTAPLSLHRSSPTLEEPILPPRPRARPLPIPPVFKTAESANTRPAIRQRQSSLDIQSSSQEEQREQSSDDEEEESASPPVERGSTSNLPSGAVRAPTREASLGYTDLELFASRLADQAQTDGTNYEGLHLISEFLGPAKPVGATAEEIEALSVGVVEVLRKRVVGKRENGKDKIKVSLQLMGVKVDRCGVCLLQFKEGNLACLFPCLHV
jgi:hypothetical protein